MKKYRCPCCGCFTYEHPPDGNYDICPVCFWEDDPLAYQDPEKELCCNGVSLLQAKENYLTFGACRSDMVRHVRKPTDNELFGSD